MNVGVSLPTLLKVRDPIGAGHQVPQILDDLVARPGASRTRPAGGEAPARTWTATGVGGRDADLRFSR
jgi:hypothetical protein